MLVEDTEAQASSVTYFEFGIAPKIVPGRRALQRTLRCAEQLHRLGVLPPFYVISR